MFGELPSHPQLLNFRDNIHKEMLVHEKLISFFGGFKSDAHPMAIMVTEIDVIACGHAVLTYIFCVMKPQVGVVGALSAFFNDSLDIHSPESRELACTRMVTHTDFIELVTRHFNCYLPGTDCPNADNCCYCLQNPYWPAYCVPSE